MTAIRVRAMLLTPAIAVLATLMASPLGAEMVLAGGPSASHRSGGVMYGGTTSNGWPVIVEVTRNGRLMKRVVGGISSDCSQGGRYTFPSSWRYLKIAGNGSFKATYNDSYLSDGTEVTVSESFVGKFNRARTRLTGTWRVSTTFREVDGTVDVCDSGSLRFVARQ